MDEKILHNHPNTTAEHIGDYHVGDSVPWHHVHRVHTMHHKSVAKLLTLSIIVLLVTAGYVGMRNLDVSVAFPRAETPDVFVTKIEDDDDVSSVRELYYKNISSHSWCSSARGDDPEIPASLRMDYRFSPNGEFSYTHISDVVEEEVSGRWNLLAAREKDGVIITDNGEALYTMIDGDTLYIGDLALTRCDPITGVDRDGEIGDLSDVALPEIYSEITRDGTEWIKTNEFDTYRLPSSITFLPDGRYTAQYHHGCTEDGTWSIRNGELIRWISSDGCDFRSFGAERFHRYPLSLDGEFLQFEGQMYRNRTGAPIDEGIVMTQFDRRDGLRMTIYYVRPLNIDVETTLEIDVTNAQSQHIELETFSISQQMYQQTDDSFSADGAQEDVYVHDFENVFLEPGQSHSFQAVVEFSDTGYRGITFAFEYSDSVQKSVKDTFIFAPTTPGE